MQKLLAYLIFPLTIVMLFVGCNKIDEFTKFDMEYTTQLTISPTNGVSIPIEILSPDIETNSTSEFEINDTRKDLIESVVLSRLEVDLLSPENGDFSFLKSVEVLINADGLDEISVAILNDIPSNAKFLKLNPSGADLQEYIKKDVFSLKLKIVSDEFTSTSHKVSVYSLFNVDAKILGQ